MDSDLNEMNAALQSLSFISCLVFLKSSQLGSKSWSVNTLNNQAYVVPFKAATINEAFSSSMSVQTYEDTMEKEEEEEDKNEQEAVEDYPNNEVNPPELRRCPDEAACKIKEVRN
ncbi:unnamed protein product [Coccothraustes coccothraustes]